MSGFRLPKVHPVEFSKELLETLGFGVPTEIPGAAFDPRAATRRGSGQPGWLGRRPSGARPLFLTRLREDRELGGASQTLPYFRDEEIRLLLVNDQSGSRNLDESLIRQQLDDGFEMREQVALEM